MKTKVLKKTKKSLSGISANVAIMSVFLVFGLVVGILFAKSGNSSVLNDFIGNDLIEINQNGIGEYSFFRTFFNITKYTLIIIFLAFCAVGIFLIPLVVFTKGFMISLSVSSLVATLGKTGILCALAMFGIQTLAQLPILLIASAMSFEFSKVSSSVILPQKYKFAAQNVKTGAFLLCLLVCIVFLFVASILDFLITPKLVLIVSKTLFYR